jgi:hypothetical protein
MLAMQGKMSDCLHIRLPLNQMVQMRKTILVALLLSIAVIPFVAVAQPKRLEPPLFEAVLKTARDYAADRTLVFYCLRKNDEMRPFLYAAVHLDLSYALQLVRSAGADDRQRAELIEAVLGNVRAAARDEDDAQRDKDCVAANVEKSLAEIKGVGAPLFMRPPFDKLKP